MAGVTHNTELNVMVQGNDNHAELVRWFDELWKEAEDFETIARRHAALPASRQSFGARLAAFARFLAVPILPGFDPVAYDRGQEQPVPPTPRLALDDADWRASHGCEGSAVVRGPLKEALA